MSKAILVRIIPVIALGVSTALAAQTPERWTTVGYAGGFRIDRSTHGWCLATTEYANGTAFAVAYGPDQTKAKLIVANGAWRSLVPGRTYTAEVKMGRRAMSGIARAYMAPTGVTALETYVDRTTFGANWFTRGGITIAIDGIEVLKTNLSNEGHAAMNECAKGAIDPFAGSQQ